MFWNRSWNVNWRKTLVSKKVSVYQIVTLFAQQKTGNYTPQIIPKYSRNADGIEEKILALYACGMSQRDISEQIKNLYDVDISPELISKVSEKIMPEVTMWQTRPLEKIYPFIFMDAGVLSCK